MYKAGYTKGSGGESHPPKNVTTEYRWETGRNLGEKRNCPDIYRIGTKNRWNETEVDDNHPITMNGASMLRTEMEKIFGAEHAKKP